MANPAWPSFVPAPLLDGVSYTSNENTIRTQMDGATKVRRRFTRVIEVVSFALMVNQAQRQVLDDFVAMTLQDVLPFDWREFRSPPGTSATYRFRARPSYTPQQGNTYWRAQIELDLLARGPAHFPISNEFGVLITTETGAPITT